jgi:hypothetical protein
VSIDIFIIDSPSVSRRDEPIESLFDDDEAPYYTALVPLFERIEKETGQLIDEYGEATFSSDQLPHLIRLLKEKREECLRAPNSWTIPMGTQVKPEYKELSGTVNRSALLQTIDRMTAAAGRALEKRAYLALIGD